MSFQTVLQEHSLLRDVDPRTELFVVWPRLGLRARRGQVAPIGERTVKSGVGCPETAMTRHASGSKSDRVCLIQVDIIKL